MGWFSKVANFAKKAYAGVKGALNTGLKIGSKILNNPVVDAIRDVAPAIPIIGGTIGKGLDFAQRALATGERISKTIERGEDVARNVGRLRNEGFTPAVINDIKDSAQNFGFNAVSDYNEFKRKKG